MIKTAKKNWFLVEFKLSNTAKLVETENTYDEVMDHYEDVLGYTDKSLTVTPVTRELYRLASKVMSSLDMTVSNFEGCDRVSF